MSMKRKYRRTGTVILGIFIAAVLCVGLVVYIVYQNGLRYIKSDTGVKFFGYMDKDDKIISGRLWLSSTAADIKLQKFYIVESKNPQFEQYLPDASSFSLTADRNNNVLDFINSVFADNLSGLYPFDNIIFNRTDAGVFFREETFEVLISGYEDVGNKLLSGEIYALNGIKWVLVLPPLVDKPPFYTDFEVVQADNSAKKYKGDIVSFLNKEEINFASFNLSDGTVINLYSAPGIYRLNYDKGLLKGDLFIGRLNPDFEKDGRGLYFSKAGNIYYGDFAKDIKTGFCELFSEQGDIYSGYITDGKKNGDGILKWSDGSSYEGSFTDNMKNGRGKYIFPDKSFYEGDYVNDVKHGQGKYQWSNGDVYEGDFKDDLYDGHGKYTWSNKDYYEGDFNHNTLHGWGTYYWTSGRSYKGYWILAKMVTPDEIPDDIDFDVSNRGGGDGGDGGGIDDSSGGDGGLEEEEVVED